MSDESNNTGKSRLAENNVAWQVRDPNPNTSVRNITSTDIDGENVQVELAANPLFQISWTQSKKNSPDKSKFGNFNKILDDWKEEKRNNKFALRNYTRILTDQAEQFTKTEYKTIYRGLSHEIFKTPIGKIGDIIWADQFTSCSLNRNESIKFLDLSDNICSGTLFKIDTNTAIDVREFSKFQYEEELVIPPLIKFIIKDVRLVVEGGRTYYEIYMVVEDIETIITNLPGTKSTNTDTYSNTKADYEPEFGTALQQEIQFNSLLNDNWKMAKQIYRDKADDIIPAVIYSYTSDNRFYSKLNAELRQWCNHQRMENFLYLNVVLEMNKDQDEFKTCITLRKANGFKEKLVNSHNMADRNIELYFLNVTKTECASTVKISGDVAIIWKFPNFKTEMKFDRNIYPAFDLNILSTVISNLLNHIQLQ